MFILIIVNPSKPCNEIEADVYKAARPGPFARLETGLPDEYG